MTAKKKSASDTPSSNNIQQSQTFANPNDGIVTEEMARQRGLDPNEANLASAEAVNPNEFVRVSDAYFKEDQDPTPASMTEADKKFIMEYSELQSQIDANKAKFVLQGFLDWQARQLYYTVFLNKGTDVNSKVTTYERREYRYHRLSSDAKLAIAKAEGELNSIITKNNLFTNGVVSEALYRDVLSYQGTLGAIIEEKKMALLDLKFTSYFLEDNKAILGQIDYVDKRDMVAAAEKREEGLPFSRKLDSSRITSDSGKVTKINLKSAGN